MLPNLHSSALLIVSNEAKALSLVAELQFSQKREVLYLPDWQQSPYDINPVAPTIVQQRIETIQKVLNNPEAILVTTHQAALQRLLPSNIYQQLSISLSVGQELTHSALLHTLHNMGYVRMMNAINPGEFAVRGALIDIAVNESFGIRLDFLTKRIDSIRKYDLFTQKSSEKITNYNLSASIELPLGSEYIMRCLEQLDNGDVEYYRQFLSQGYRASGVEYLFSLFVPQVTNIFDLLPHHAIYVEHNLWLDEFLTDCAKRYEERTKEGKIATLPPEAIWLNQTEWHSYVKKAQDIHYPTRLTFSVADLCKSKQVSCFNILQDLLEKHTIIIAFTNEYSLEKFKQLANDHDVPCFMIKHIDEIRHRQLHITVWPLWQSYQHQDVLFITQEDLWGATQYKQNKRLQHDLLEELSALSEGDLVVHIDHGVGKFIGIETLTVLNIAHDFISLLYAENSKLYIPVEHFDLLTKHGDNNSALDKLGSTNWQMRKARIKNRIKLAASELMKIAAERMRIKMPMHYYDEELYHSFCQSFPYAETEDQLQAIEDVKQDLLSGKPMDRLICGDVGYGKTEVAMRAIFMALTTDDKKQIAILVPTTLLARQHYKNFVERFKNVPVKVVQLSKFTKDTKVVKQEIADGKADIIIGTHALLAKNIKFYNLGMVVIDEEQHFGVKQKERLKEIKTACHVLTLSATPIPRTLQMSMSGLKGLSLIATPPAARLPIRTHVMPFDALTIQEAIRREIQRGGRVFIVTPRLAFIDAVTDFLRTNLPAITFAIATGGMSANELDETMNKFYDGAYQVLVATNIVESGLDIPDANTIIIYNAHLFGLAQLYQIRGRVGRGNIQAYAYLTYQSGMILSTTAKKRLEIMHSLNSLGAGFSIASHDMDLRGYGNLVGEEQSGHIKEVGFELYQQMLEEALREVQNQEVTPQEAPQINLGVAVQIPESYIPDSALRLATFRRLANIDNLDALSIMQEEMLDRFGMLPKATHNLCDIIAIKIMAKQLFIRKLDYTKNGLLFTFSKVPDALLEYLLNMHAKVGDYQLKPNNKLLIARQWVDETLRLQAIKELLFEMHEHGN